MLSIVFKNYSSAINLYESMILMRLNTKLIMRSMSTIFRHKNQNYDEKN